MRLESLLNLGILVHADGLEHLLEVLVVLGLLVVVDRPDGLGVQLDELAVDLGDELGAQNAVRRDEQAPLIATAVGTEEDDLVLGAGCHLDQLKSSPHAVGGNVESL